jgi:hypothetical protein
MHERPTGISRRFARGPRLSLRRAKPIFNARRQVVGAGWALGGGDQGIHGVVGRDRNAVQDDRGHGRRPRKHGHHPVAKADIFRRAQHVVA